MPETPEKREERLLRELEGKNIEHYSVLLSAWIETKMERDKTLVTLSAAAIGLLITILTTVGTNSILEIILFAISICAFLVTIWSALKIYQLNSEHIEKALKGSSENDPRLEKYDKLSIGAFLAGALFALIIGILSAENKLTNKEDVNMSKQNVINGVATGDSLHGINELHPEIIAKSLNGVTNLNPVSVQPTSQPQEQNSSTTQSNTNSSAANSSN